MTVTPDTRRAIHQLLLSASPTEQLALREKIRDENYYTHIWNIYLNNPFMKLTDEEANHFRQVGSMDLLTQLILARDRASKSITRKISVFCMPKSGSSFVQSIIQKSLALPLISMTGFADGGQNSHFGMNSREQELDELAIIKSTLRSKGGFISQNHTRCSPYLITQMQFYGIFPIVTVRNVLDCIVSFDDMMISWRGTNDQLKWLSDTQFHLPIEYPELRDQERYRILSYSLGVWLIGFYISWNRFMRIGAVDPLLLRYEEEILNPSQLVQKITSRVPMTDQQAARLEGYAKQPDARKARLNVGVRGRGQIIHADTVQVLTDYARSFRSELSDEEIRYLIR